MQQGSQRAAPFLAALVRILNVVWTLGVVFLLVGRRLTTLRLVTLGHTLEKDTCREENRKVGAGGSIPAQPKKKVEFEQGLSWQCNAHHRCRSARPPGFPSAPPSKLRAWESQSSTNLLPHQSSYRSTKCEHCIAGGEVGWDGMGWNGMKAGIKKLLFC